MKGGIIIRGTDLEFAVTLTAQGFSQQDDEWEVSFVVGSRTAKTIDKSQAILRDGTWLVTAETAGWPTGRLYMRFKAHVPDNAFANAKRTEIVIVDTDYIIVA